MHLIRLVAGAVLFALATNAVQAQTTVQEVRVVTRVLPPMVVLEKGELSGFSIELWNRIAERLQLKTRYQVAPDVGALLEEIRAGKADVGISAVSITSAREREFEFSQPMLNAGLQIMVRVDGKAGAPITLWDLLGLLFSRTSLIGLGIAALLVLVPAHIVWFLEHNHRNGSIPHDNYIPGIFHVLFGAPEMLASQAEQAPRQRVARIMALFWIFAGAVFIGLYTAQLAATLTVKQMQGGINDPGDLPGRKVATTRGSTAVAFLREVNAQVVEVSRISEAYKALVDQDVDALVFDAPVLQYYAAREGRGSVQVVGSLFRQEDYGIVFPPGSSLRKRVNGALLALREDGSYQRLYDRWFVSK